MAEKKTTNVDILVYPEGHEKAGQPTGQIVWTFPDETKETFDISQVNDETKFRLALHGTKQKVSDSYAGAAGETDPLAYAKLCVKETIAQLYAGQWRVGGGGGPRVNELAQATARATGQTLEACVELIGAMSDDEKKVWRKKPAIAAALATIAAEKAIAKATALSKAAEEAKAKEEAAKTA